MPRWMRMLRGMFATGLTFTIGVAVAGMLFGVPVWLFGAISGTELLQIVGKCSVVAFPVGVAFSGALALSVRGRALEKLSLARVAVLGAGAGLLYFALIAMNAFRVWSVSDALVNLVILTVMGSASAAATLLLARRAMPALAPDDGDRSISSTPSRALAASTSDAMSEAPAREPVTLRSAPRTSR